MPIFSKIPASSFSFSRFSSLESSFKSTLDFSNPVVFRTCEPTVMFKSILFLSTSSIVRLSASSGIITESLLVFSRSMVHLTGSLITAASCTSRVFLIAELRLPVILTNASGEVMFPVTLTEATGEVMLSVTLTDALSMLLFSPVFSVVSFQVILSTNLVRFTWRFILSILKLFSNETVVFPVKFFRGAIVALPSCSTTTVPLVELKERYATTSKYLVRSTSMLVLLTKKRFIASISSSLRSSNPTSSAARIVPWRNCSSNPCCE